MDTAPIKDPKNTRIHPRVDLEIISGKRGLVQDSIVATPSMVDRRLGMEVIHRANTPRTKATECNGGLVEGNFVLSIM